MSAYGEFRKLARNKEFSADEIRLYFSTKGITAEELAKKLSGDLKYYELNGLQGQRWQQLSINDRKQYELMHQNKRTKPEEYIRKLNKIANEARTDNMLLGGYLIVGDEKLSLQFGCNEMQDKVSVSGLEDLFKKQPTLDQAQINLPELDIAKIPKMKQEDLRSYIRDYLNVLYHIYLISLVINPTRVAIGKILNSAHFPWKKYVHGTTDFNVSGIPKKYLNEILIKELKDMAIACVSGKVKIVSNLASPFAAAPVSSFGPNYDSAIASSSTYGVNYGSAREADRVGEFKWEYFGRKFNFELDENSKLELENALTFELSFIPNFDVYSEPNVNNDDVRRRCVNPYCFDEDPIAGTHRCTKCFRHLHGYCGIRNEDHGYYNTCREQWTCLSNNGFRRKCIMQTADETLAMAEEMFGTSSAGEALTMPVDPKNVASAGKKVNQKKVAKNSKDDSTVDEDMLVDEKDELNEEFENQQELLSMAESHDSAATFLGDLLTAKQSHSKIQDYVQKHPRVTLKNLKEIFPDDDQKLVADLWRKFKYIIPSLANKKNT